MSTYRTAAAAAAALAENPQVEQRVNDETLRNQLISTLIDLRLSKNITQQQVAEYMQVDPSTVSRFESGDDAQYSEILGYLGALNLGMSIMFCDPSLPAAEQIKQCVFEIHRHLESLVKLAQSVKDDPAIVSKIHEFCGEVLFNFVVGFEDNVNRLPALEIPAKSPAPQLTAAKHTAPQSVVETRC